MSDNQALRATILQQADSYGSKRRFGLFSSPVSHAVGDDGQYKTKLHPRDQSGKPQTQPRGLFTNPPRTGQLNKSYFGTINTLASGQVKDEYMDPERKLLQLQNQNFKKGFSKDQMFKPASGFKEAVKPPYEYKEENNPEKDPKRNRGPEGKVKSELRNLYTNPQTTVIRSFFRPFKYLQDPYERAHQLQLQHSKREKSLQAEAAFKLNLHPSSTFSKQRQVFGTDTELAEKKHRESNFNIYKHQNRWKSNNPNKSGLQGYFAPFPPYMQDPPQQAKSKPIGQNPKESFRRMSVASSKPSPSIAYHPSLVRTISHTVTHRP